MNSPSDGQAQRAGTRGHVIPAHAFALIESMYGGSLLGAKTFRTDAEKIHPASPGELKNANKRDDKDTVQGE